MMPALCILLEGGNKDICTGLTCRALRIPGFKGTAGYTGFCKLVPLDEAPEEEDMDEAEQGEEAQILTADQGVDGLEGGLQEGCI